MVTVIKVLPSGVGGVAAALSMVGKRIPLHQTFQRANQAEKGRTRPRPSPKYVPRDLTEQPGLTQRRSGPLEGLIWLDFLIIEFTFSYDSMRSPPPTHQNIPSEDQPLSNCWGLGYS